MGLFDGLFRRKQPGNNDALMTVMQKYPHAWLCLAHKTAAASNLISSAVVLDTSNNVGVCFVTTDMTWLSTIDFRRVSTERWVEPVRLDPPLLISHEAELYQQHQFTAARILIELGSGEATYIATPWWPDDFNLICSIDRWLIWSFTNELRRDGQHYWGFGDFGSETDFDQFIARIVR